jgi:hypothetical protein
MNWSCDWDGGRRNVYRTVVGKHPGKHSLARPRRRWEVNVKIDLSEMDCDHQMWMELAYDCLEWRTFVIAVLNLRAMLSQC